MMMLSAICSAPAPRRNSRSLLSLSFFTTIYFLGIITYGIAIPAGLFIPVILAGATYGRLVGILFETMSTLDTGLFALLGAASFLGGHHEDDSLTLSDTSRAYKRSVTASLCDAGSSHIKNSGGLLQQGRL
ncbi:Chloride channel protein CLC-c-like protein [Drosera capensis]